MSNLRVIHDNAADRATITASSTAGSLSASNMLTDLKGQIHRSVGTSVSYTLTWTDFETIGGVALPACNLTADATIRVRVYDAVSAGTLLKDTGTVYACPGQSIDLWDWTLPLNSNAFAFGGATKSAVWLGDHYPAKRLLIDIVDTTNPSGYIDCARLVAGGYWQPAYNAEYGATNSVDDGSKNSRNDAGDLITDRFAMSESVKLDLRMMPATDRARMNQIMRSSGISRPVFISAVSEDDDVSLEQDYMIYGKRQNSPITFESYGSHGYTINIEGW